MAPRLLLLNDLHLEDHPYLPCTEGYDGVVLAGDIHTRERGVRWALNAFKVPVFYVPGNHEGYGVHWEHNVEKMRKLAQDTHVHILHGDSVVWNGMRILGTTGWTTFEAWPDPQEAMQDAGQGRDFYGSGMRDYRHIRTGAYRRITPITTARWAHDALAWLQKSCAEPFDGHTLIITHHPPSPLSLPDKKVGTISDAAYVNVWDAFVERCGALCWFHGHTHHKGAYRIGNTMVATNPRGYPGQELEHDPKYIVTCTPEAIERMVPRFPAERAGHTGP